MEVQGNSLEHLFREALRGMMSILKKEVPKIGTRITRSVKIESGDETALLVDFLNEALSLSHINGEIYTDLIFKNFSKTSLEAELIGAAAQVFDEDIKAVTYHEADVKQDSKGKWVTNLIFDI